MEAKKAKRWLAPLRNTPLHPQWLLRHTDDREDFRDLSGTVLDVGCADKHTQAVLPASCRYVGLDYPATASSLYGTHPDVFGDAQRLPFPDRSFGAVLMLHVLEHLPDPDKAISEAMRVLQGGGRLVIETPFAYPVHDAPFDFQRWTPKRLALLATRHGVLVRDCRPAGTPGESGAVLFNLGLALTLLQWSRRKSPWLIHAPAFAMRIPIVNGIG